MKNFENYLSRGRSRLRRGLARKLGLLAVGAAFCLSPIGLTRTYAAASPVTQLDYIQSLVSLMGEKDLFNSASTAADYIQWAISKGMKPSGGWSATAALSRSDFAQTVSQLYNIKPEKNADYVAALEKQGIAIPDGPAVTRTALVGVVDDFGFQSKMAKHAKIKPSKHKKKSPTKLKTPTKKKTPKKPTKPKVKVPTPPKPPKPK